MSRNLFRAYCRKNGDATPPVVSSQTLLLAFEESGILHDDKRLSKFFAALKKAPPELTESQFESLLEISPTLVEQVLTKQLAIPQFQDFCGHISDIFAEVEENRGGKLANYIPQLEKVDPEKFAVSVCTVDGQRFNLGDAEDYFCVQSCSKPIT
ncbi:MAG: glutaminase [Candidatus Melainabacteria bacterium]|nr:glutaminase [Candidatus Melainabacteria bacterium]